MKKSTVINIAYYAITLSGIAIFAYLQYIDIIPSTGYALGYAFLFVALMITLRNLILKKFF